jgi:uncharacterized protein YbaP (TraB family)
VRVTPGRLAAFLAALLLLTAGGCATLLARPHSLVVSNALLWRVSPPSPESGPLILLGSIHAAREPTRLGPSLQAWWRTTTILVVEVDTSALSQAEAAAALLRRGTLLNGTLAQLVAPATWQALAAFARANALEPAAFAHTRPWLAAMMVEEVTLENVGMRNEFGVERVLLDQARREQRPIQSLETLDEQFQTFAGLPGAVQEQYLLDALSAEAPTAMLDFLALWKRGDPAALEARLAADTRPEMEPFYEAVFLQRNRRMAERLVDWSRDGQPRFVVVGGGHTVGEGSLPALLAEAGWSVQRIQAAPPPPTRILAP